VAPLDADPEKPLGLVLSGGGARGAFQVGVWNVLRGEHIKKDPLVVSGTSAGALNGALIAAGLTPKKMMEFWCDLADKPPVVANDRFFAGLERAISKLLIREPIRGFGRRKREASIMMRLLGKHPLWRRSGLYAIGLEFLMTARFDTVSALLEEVDAPFLFDTSPLLDRLKKVMGGYSVPNDRIRLAINSVDVNTGRVLRIVNYRPQKAVGSAMSHYRYEPHISLEMILASASIPLLFNPVRVGNHLLWDGGLLVNSPMAPAVALGATRIVPVLVTTRSGDMSRATASFGGAIERLVDAFLENAYNIDRKLLLDRNMIADSAPERKFRRVELYRAIRPESSRLFNAGSYLYFERKNLKAMYDAGEQAARDWLAGGPELDDRTRED
jgi:predicted acylesterase/phospholipase RssA